jgi:hypothetical protein
VDKLRHRSKIFYHVYEVIKTGLVRCRAQEEEIGAEVDDDEEVLDMDERDANGAALCAFLVRRLTRDGGICDQVL